MSGDSSVSAARLWPSGRTAVALGVCTRTLDRLVARGVLPAPVVMSGRRMWPADVVERVRQERLSHRPSNRRHAVTGTTVLRRLRHDRSTLSRAFLRAWEICGLPTAVDIVRRHGALEGLRGLTLEQLGRATAELEAATRLVRGL